MRARTIQEIEAAFREMGLDERTWGQERQSDIPPPSGESPVPHIFIRIETTTTPLGEKTDADLA